MRISDILTPDVIAAYNARMEREREAIRQSAIEEGLARGLLQGLEQGLSQGRERGLEQGFLRGLEQGLSLGLSQGLERGELQVLERLCQRTLKRPLSEEEREGLAQSLCDEGLDAIMDTIIACSAEELERWLEG